MECTLHLPSLTSISHFSHFHLSLLSPLPQFQLMVTLSWPVDWHVCRLWLSFSFHSIIYRHWLIPIVFHTYNHVPCTPGPAPGSFLINQKVAHKSVHRRTPDSRPEPGCSDTMIQPAMPYTTLTWTCSGPAENPTVVDMYLRL